MQKLIQELGGIGVFGAISICLFFLVFGGALLWALRLKKPFLSVMESLPLRDEETETGRKGANLHE